MIKVTVSAIVNPTESREKVYSALKQLFPEIDFNYEAISRYSGEFFGEGDIYSLKIIHYYIREEEIIDTSRTMLERGLSEDDLSTSFIISKQAATVGHLSYPGQEETLGSINITVKADTRDRLEIFFDWLTPPTQNGIPDFEMDIGDV